MNDSDRHQVVRPTEAQLRWSQFHHHRRAVVVKHNVERLWLLPKFVSDVQGARSDDGNTTEESNSNVDMNIMTMVPREKPVISRGRRAMLRISKRALEERHKEILKYGFHRGNDANGDSGSDEDDGLAAIFAEESFLRKRKRRHHSRKRASNDEERARRFDAAFHAMMMNLAAAQPQHPEREIVVPTKIWSRPDGPHFDTVDWGVGQKISQSAYSAHRQVFHDGEQYGHHVVDEQYEYPYELEEGEQPFSPSPVRQKFSDIVSRIQQNVVSSKLERSPGREAAVPTMRLSKYFVPAQLEDYQDDEKKEEEEQQMMNRYLEGATNETSRKRLEVVFAQMDGGSPTVQERVRDFGQTSCLTEELIKGILETMDANVVDELEALDPGISERLLIRYIEETNFDPSKDNVDAVCQHLDIFARRYLVEAKFFEGQQRHKDLSGSQQSPHANASARRSSGLVKNFVDKIQASEEVKELISADGRLHKPTFARLVTRYLGEMTGGPSPSFRGDKATRRGSGRVADRYLGRAEDGHGDDDNQDSIETRSTTEIVNRFIAKMQDAVEYEPVVDPYGNLDRDVFEKMVSRYLAEASGLEEEAVLHAVDMQALSEEGPRKVDVDAQYIDAELDAVPVDTLVSAPPRFSASFAKRFIAQMQQAAEVEPLVTADGKLNKSTFEKLTTRYLVVEPDSRKDNDFLSQARSPLALAQARRNAGRVGRRNHAAQQEPTNDDEFAGPQSPGFIGRFIRQMEDAADRESIVNSEGKLDKRAFEILVNRYLDEAAGEAVASRSGESGAEPESNDDYTAFPPFGHSSSAGFVKTFAAHMEQISRGEQFEAVDKPLLEELVLRCLVEFEKDGLLGGADSSILGGDDSKSSSTKSPRQKNSSFDCDISQLVSSGFVEGLVQHLDQVSKKDHLVDSDGKLDIRSFERNLTLYLTERTSPSKRKGTESATLVSRMSRQDFQSKPVDSRSSSGIGVPQTEGVAFASPGVASPSESDFFRQMRNVDASKTETNRNQAGAGMASPSESDFFRQMRNVDVSKTESNRNQAGAGMSRNNTTVSNSNLNGVVEGEEPVSGSGIRDEVAEDTASRLDKAHRFAGSVSNKMGGFVQMMYGKTRNKEEDFKAVAAFRQTQGDRDDASSMSSFRISDGIKQVVQNFRASKLSPRNECEEDGSERSEADDETFGNMETQPSHEGYEDQASTSLYSRDSFSQSESTASAVEFSPERAKMFHKMVMSKSALIGDANAAQSVIDTDGSEASRTAMDPDILKQLLLSPTLLTKRHQQAIRAVEKRSWEQVAYLLSANPWLAEMTDLSTNQYLLHKLALYGAGEATIDNTTGEMIAVRHPAAPEDINTDLVRMFPASVHKFDQDGNLPLHMATASANVAMIKLLGDRFPSGASVRNEDGMLPLHLIILACASPSIAALGSERSPTDIIKTILDYFPGAVAVTDNEGNLPIHTAAVALRGHTGVDVVYLLLDEAHRQVQNASGVRFRNKTTIEDMENASVQTETTISPTDSANDFDDVIHCNIVRNAFDETPLLAAIHARVGWEMIEAIARGVGGRQAALWQDSEKNNALHLLVSDRFKDPAAALSILKVAREAATVCNEEGMLPIEIACMQMLPLEVILALVLVDLPIDLDQKAGVESRDGYGGSWWYLSCECDDHYIDVVEEVVSICSYPQVREICFMKGGSDDTLISRATPKCRHVLQCALRFVGRFEFLGNSKVLSDEARGLRVFDALDYGTKRNPIPDGRRVLLKCFTREDVYLKETALLREKEVDFTFVEEVLIFACGEDGSEPVDGEPQQYYVAIERPNLNLSGVVSGMLENEECQTDSAVRMRYSGKVFSVLRVVAKALLHLHSLGVVHGNVCMENCGKYDDKWKLSDGLGMQEIGGRFEASRFGKSAPPEAIEPAVSAAMEHQAAFRFGMVTEASIDSWAFGKLAYEVLAGEELVEFGRSEEVSENHRALLDIMHWSDFDQGEVHKKLKRVGISKVGIDLVVQCLAPRAEDRPNMDEILSHPVWKELRRQLVSSGEHGRRRGRPRNDGENEI